MQERFSGFPWMGGTPAMQEHAGVRHAAPTRILPISTTRRHPAGERLQHRPRDQHPALRQDVAPPSLRISVAPIFVDSTRAGHHGNAVQTDLAATRRPVTMATRPQKQAFASPHTWIPFVVAPSREPLRDTPSSPLRTASACPSAIAAYTTRLINCAAFWGGRMRGECAQRPAPTGGSSECAIPSPTVGVWSCA